MRSKQGMMPIASEGEKLNHYGVRGMRWGVKKASSAASSTKTATKTAAKTGRYAAVKTAIAAKEFTNNQKKVAIIAVGTGAAVTASILTGPIGAMTVSAVTRVVEMKVIPPADILATKTDDLNDNKK